MEYGKKRRLDSGQSANTPSPTTQEHSQQIATRIPSTVWSPYAVQFPLHQYQMRRGSDAYFITNSTFTRNGENLGQMIPTSASAAPARRSISALAPADEPRNYRAIDLPQQNSSRMSFVVRPGSSHDRLSLPPLGMEKGAKASDMQTKHQSFETKFNILRRVVPPVNALQTPAAHHRPRGIILAIEGMAGRSVSEVALGLIEAFRRTEDFQVTVVKGPRPPPEDKSLSIGDYVVEVARWHAIANDLREAVLHPDDHSLCKEHVDGEYNRKIYKDSNDNNVSKSYDESMDSSTLYDPQPIPSDTLPQQMIPLFIIPNYLLSTANSWAAALPLKDAYSAMDHWQWTATLWRGIPGPDLTIYIRDNTIEQQSHDHSKSEESAAGPQRLITARSAVEISDQLGLITVNASNDGQNSAAANRVAVRRAAFEVGEWARAISSKGALD